MYMYVVMIKNEPHLQNEEKIEVGDLAPSAKEGRKGRSDFEILAVIY